MNVKYANSEVREAAKEKGVRMWEIAERLKISETTFSKTLRHELPDKKKQCLLGLIDEIAAQNGFTKEDLF